MNPSGPSIVGSGVANRNRVAGQSPTARASDYTVLSRRIRAAGLLNRRSGRYAMRIGVTIAAFAALWVIVTLLGNSWHQMVVAVLLGAATTQIAFLGHDGAHQQVFASRRANDGLGRVAANLLTGLSFGWWVDKHNRHHANPNKEDHDPDIGDGVLAFTTNQVAGRTGRLGRLIVAHQAWLFFPLLTLEGVNLHVASIRSLLSPRLQAGRRGRRGLERAMLSLHIIAYVGALLLIMSPGKALLFAVIHQAVFGLYMGCSFAPNHKGMPILAADSTLDYLRRQVLTSRNIRGGMFTDLLLGGLNYQIEHHLFPSMPRTSLRAAQRIVRAHCAELQICYTETSLIGSYRAALRHLNQIGRPLRASALSSSGSRHR